MATEKEYITDDDNLSETVRDSIVVRIIDDLLIFRKLSVKYLFLIFIDDFSPSVITKNKRIICVFLIV